MKQFSSENDSIQDWVQRAFIKAFNNINSFKGDAKFSTWLFKIALNEMHTDFRKSSKHEYTFSNDYEGIFLLNEDENFVWDIEMKELLHSIDSQKRTVFLLFEVEGYSHAEISEMLNISENASRTILHRCKKLLQEKYFEMRGVG